MQSSSAGHGTNVRMKVSVVALANQSMKWWAAASADAIQLTTRWPTWAKGWLRSARACEGQGSHAVAAQHYAHAWQLLGKDPEGVGLI
eukprot:scaffold246923_cov24-Tisochrysis_lutea.AAC.3